MESRFTEIELYEYPTIEKTAFDIFNLNEREYLSINSNEIVHVEVNTVTGVIVLIGKILGAPKELELSKWKADNKNLIKRLDIRIVRAGRAREYILNAGIMKVVEDYNNMTYMAVFQHDKEQFSQKMFHSVELLRHGVVMNIKIDKSKIGIHNVSKSTLLNLWLSGVGYGLGVVTAVGIGTLSIPATITLAIGGSLFLACTIDFNLELYGESDGAWIFNKVGKNDLLQQLTGELGHLLDSLAKNENKEVESTFENIYYYSTSFYSLFMGAKAGCSLFNPKSYRAVSKTFQNGSYIKINWVKLKNITNFNKVESATRKFAGGIFINDITNLGSGGKINYDEFKKAKERRTQ